MSGRSTITYLRNRLCDMTGITPSHAGNMIQEAMEAGEIEAVAYVITIRPDSADADSGVAFEDYVLKPEHWHRCKIDWEEKYLYFVFYLGHEIYLTSDLTVDSLAATAFLRARDPLRVPEDPEAAPNLAGKKAEDRKSGGRPPKHDWDGAFAYCAYWVFKNHLPNEKQRLVELVTDWFRKQDGGEPKDSREIAKRVGRVYDHLSKWLDSMPDR